MEDPKTVTVEEICDLLVDFIPAQFVSARERRSVVVPQLLAAIANIAGDVTSTDSELLDIVNAVRAWRWKQEALRG